MAPTARLLVLLCAALLRPAHASTSASVAPPAPLTSARPGDVRTLLLTDCSKYHDWQAIAAAYAWRESGQPGALTRVAACSDADRASFPKAMLDYVDTQMAPQAAHNKENDDTYGAYNKPKALSSWLDSNPAAKEAWLLILDPDMLLRHPIKPEGYDLQEDYAAAAYYDYLHGVSNDFAARHVPEIEPRGDSLMGAPGRRADKVGAPYLLRAGDARRVAPLWYDYTVRVRNDPEAHKDSGDAAAHQAQSKRIGIAKMYGYALGAAKAGLWHKWGSDFMVYPMYEPTGIPRSLHYGLHYQVGNWSFDKHWYSAFDVHKCPPWSLDSPRPSEGVFPPPPHPDQLNPKDYMAAYTQLLAVQAMSLVNAAICDYHMRNCPPSEQLTAVCSKAKAHYEDVKAELAYLEGLRSCVDCLADCDGWAKREPSECVKSEDFMRKYCAPACGHCNPQEKYLPRSQRPKPAAAAAPAPAAAPAAAAAGAEGAKSGAAAAAKARSHGGADHATDAAQSGAARVLQSSLAAASAAVAKVGHGVAAAANGNRTSAGTKEAGTGGANGANGGKECADDDQSCDGSERHAFWGGRFLEVLLAHRGRGVYEAAGIVAVIGAVAGLAMLSHARGRGCLPVWAPGSEPLARKGSKFD